MTDCLITLHTYGSWMVDRVEGHHNRRVRGLQGRKPALGVHHRGLMKHPEAVCGAALQRMCLLELPRAAVHQRWRLHAAGTSPSHLHLLLGWDDERAPEALRRSVKRSLSLVAKAGGVVGPLFSRAGDCFTIFNPRKLLFHRLAYLPDHPGWFIDPQRGLRPPTHNQGLVHAWRRGQRVPDGPFEAAP